MKSIRVSIPRQYDESHSKVREEENMAKRLNEIMNTEEYQKLSTQGRVDIHNDFYSSRSVEEFSKKAWRTIRYYLRKAE